MMLFIIIEKSRGVLFRYLASTSVSRRDWRNTEIADSPQKQDVVLDSSATQRSGFARTIIRGTQDLGCIWNLFRI